MAFNLANSIDRLPSFVVHSDNLLNPPESYVLPHDLLVISCGIILLVSICLAISVHIEDDPKAGFFSSIQDLSLTSSLILFISFCLSDGNAQMKICILWLILQPIVGWGMVVLLMKGEYSIGAWFLKMCYFLLANLLFAWRFSNVPQNWASIGVPSTVIMVVLVLFSDILFVSMAMKICVRRMLEFFFDGGNAIRSEANKSKG